jgi:hypothetical protein
MDEPKDMIEQEFDYESAEVQDMLYHMDCTN